MKKKLLSTLLAISMICGCSFGVMADTATNTTGTGDTNIPVTASVSTTSASGTTSIVYRVEISWSTPTLEGTQTSDVTSYTWDAENCCYVAGTPTEGSTDVTGLSGNVTIDITNKSNERVLYSITRAATTESGWTVGFTNNTLPSSTVIAAADEAGVTDGARASMLAGSTDATALTGTAVSAPQFADTVSVTAVPHLTTSVTNFTVATYTVTLENPADPWTT